MKKKIEISDFRKFGEKFAHIIISNRSCTSPDALEESINFFKKFETTPPDMANQLKGRGTKEYGPIITQAGLRHAFSVVVKEERDVQIDSTASLCIEEGFLQWDTETKAILKSKLQDKTLISEARKELTKSYLQERTQREQSCKKALQNEESKASQQDRNAKLICFMNYVQQLSIQSDLLINSANIKSGFLSSDMFEGYAFASSKNVYPSKEEQKTVAFKRSIKQMVLNDMNGFKDQDFHTVYDRISNKMMQNHTLVGCMLAKQSGDYVYRCSYITPLMNKEKFIETVNTLKPWDGVVFEKAQEISSCLFDQDLKKRWGFIDNMSKLYKIPSNLTDEELLRHFQQYLAHCYQNSDKWENAINIARIPKNQSHEAKLHATFATFTTQILSYLSKMQNYDEIYEQLQLSLVQAKKSLVKSFAAVCKEHTIRTQKIHHHTYNLSLEKLWKEIAILAHNLEEYKEIDPKEALFIKLINDVETTLGIHDMTCKIFGESLYEREQEEGPRDAKEPRGKSDDESNKNAKAAIPEEDCAKTRELGSSAGNGNTSCLEELNSSLQASEASFAFSGFPDSALPALDLCFKSMQLNQGLNSLLNYEESEGEFFSL